MILLEHNIINLPDLEQWLDAIANEVIFPAGQEWLRQKGRKFLINHDDTAARIGSLSPNAPEWMVTRFNAGDELCRFRPNGAVQNKLLHIKDWLNSLYRFATEQQGEQRVFQQLSSDARAFLPKIAKLTIENSEQHVNNWFERIRLAEEMVGEKAVDDDGSTSGEELALYLETPQGRWVRLMNNLACKREGRLMGHCVGGYDVEKGGYQIYSFRDANNQPRITVELVTGKKLRQLKGKQNKPPVAKYQAVTIEFLNKLKPSIDAHGSGSTDIHSAGIIERDGVWGTVRDFGEIHDTHNGAELIYLEGRAGQGDEYYVWKKLPYATITMTQQQQVQQYKYMSDNFDLAQPVWEAAVHFLNNMDPVPPPQSYGTGGIAKKFCIDRKLYFATEEEVEQDFAEIDGYNMRKKALTGSVTYPVYDSAGEKCLALDATMVHKGKAGIAPPPPETVIKMMKAVGQEDATLHSHGKFGVFQKVENRRCVGPLMTFNPEALGASTVGDLFALQAVGGDMYFFDPEGQLFFEVSRSATLSHYQEQAKCNRFIRSHGAELAKLFNQNGVSPPGGRGYGATGPIWRKLGLIGKYYKWATLAATGKGEQIDGLEVHSTTKTLIVSGENGLIAEIKKETERHSTRVGMTPVFAEGVSGNEKVKVMKAAEEWRRNQPNAQNFSWSMNDVSLAKVYCTMVAPEGEEPIPNAIYPISESFVTRIVKEYPDKRMWQERPMAKCDRDYQTPGKNRYALMEPKPEGSKYTMLVRTYNFGYPGKDGEGLKTIKSMLVNDGYLMREANAENVAPFIHHINELLELEGLKVDQEYAVTKLNMTMRDGALHSLDDNPRLLDYAKGEINYEDGHAWIADKNQKGYWTLTHHVENRAETVLRVKLNGHGVSSVELNRKAQQRDPRPYMDYLYDLLELQDAAVQ